MVLPVTAAMPARQAIQEIKDLLVIQAIREIMVLPVTAAMPARQAIQEIKDLLVHRAIAEILAVMAPRVMAAQPEIQVIKEPQVVQVTLVLMELAEMVDQGEVVDLVDCIMPDLDPRHIQLVVSRVEYIMQELVRQECLVLPELVVIVVPMELVILLVVLAEMVEVARPGMYML